MHTYIIILKQKIQDFNLSDVSNAKPTQGCTNMKSWVHYSNTKKSPPPSPANSAPIQICSKPTLNQQTPVGKAI